MIRRHPRVLPLVLALLLPLLPVQAAAAPVPLDRGLLLEWSLPGPRAAQVTIRKDTLPLARVRLLTVEVALLPSGRIVLWTASARSSPSLHAPPPGPAPVILPLPGALPLFMVALTGLVVVGRRRRLPPALAAPDRAA